MEKTRSKGFTLIEILIVMAIVSILAAVAYPSYTDHVRKTHRKEAAGEVLEMASSLERVRAQRFSYLSANGLTRNVDRYNIAVTATQTTYRIVATPTGDQISDQCVRLVYTEDSVWQFLSLADTDLGLDADTCIN